MRICSKSTLVAAALCIAVSSARADPMTFSKGALIIPMQSTFQPRGGMLSAYGLIYRILQANAPGHLNENHPVTVYIVNDSNKKSPNRCVPTNFGNRIAGVANPTANPLGTWNDGCDINIPDDGSADTAEQPVTAVDYSIPFPDGGMYPDAPVPTYDDTGAWPRYNWSGITLNHAGGFTNVHYLGGPFVIDASDAPYVIDLIRNGDHGTLGLTGTGVTPKSDIDIFSDFQRPLSSHCVPSSITQDSLTPTTTQSSVGCHYVMMHQATRGFTANVTRRINVAPRSFFLYYSNVLDNYLQVAGLYVSGTTNHADSRGCIVGNTSGCTYNGSTCTSGSECPAANVYHGNIYDYAGDTENQYRSANYPKGLINQLGPDGKRYYHLFWAPHWNGSGTQLPDGGLASGSDTTSVANLVDYVNSPNTAIMTECASITLYENGAGDTVGSCKSSVCNSFGGPAHGSNFLFTDGITVSSTVSGNNCTDPEWPSSSSTNCASFPNPSNIFSQLGDWPYRTVSGSNPGYSPLSGSAYQPYTQQLITTSNGQDAFDIGQKDPRHGTVVYVAGHDVSGQPDGARVVLSSMLNLDAEPVSHERAEATPAVASYDAGNPAVPDEVLTPTFQAVSGYDTSDGNAVQIFNAANPSTEQMWTFPYYPGDFRAHGLSGSGALTAGEQDLSAATLWDASAMDVTGGINPKPGQRNLFTYFGGYPKANPALNGGGAAPNGVLQLGWTPESVDGTLLNTAVSAVPNSTCVDVMGINVASRTQTTQFDDLEPANLHLVVGSDGLCDLQEAVNFSKLNTGSDWDTVTASNMATFLTDVPNVATMLQRVRGYCYSGDNLILRPTESQCLSTDYTDQENRAHLGGLVNSTPAVEYPSTNISDACTSGSSCRPVVAFVGGWDGQLHAIYLGGGNGYSGPASSVDFAEHNSASDPLRDATSKFNTVWDGTAANPSTFTPPAAGTELWSFIPASQLPHLQDNSAQVDASPKVMDVFADFAGTGLREWHTVVVASVGKNGNELFALDVTDPLRPRLLWDLVGSLFQTGSTPYYSPTALLNDSLTASSATYASCTDPTHQNYLPGSCQSPKWIEERALFHPYPQTDDTYANGGGRVDTKFYDYQDLSGSSSFALAETRVGLEPWYLAYVATNNQSLGGGTGGLEVFAIDLSTGQKVWQWEHAYGTDSPARASDAKWLPPAPTVSYGAQGAAAVLVGDAEGRIWELDAQTGVNLNVSTTLPGCSASAPCRYPAFDAAAVASTTPQPISTNIALARLPNSVSGSLAPFANGVVLLVGTGGANWGGTNWSTVEGNLYVLPYDTEYRVPIFSGQGGEDLSQAPSGTPPAYPAFASASDVAAAAAHGVLQAPGAAPFWTTSTAGERLFGNIAVAGRYAFFSTAVGAVNLDDVLNLSGSISGHTYEVDLGAASAGTSSATQLQSLFAGFGGPALYTPPGASSPTSALIDEVGKINRINLSPPPSGQQPPGPVVPNSLTHQLRNWILRFLQ